jgi:putative acetyltransferase
MRGHGLTLGPGRADELDALHALWLAAVRATHGFLAAGDLEFYSRLVREEYLPGAALTVARDARGTPLGFMGLTMEEGPVDAPGDTPGPGLCAIDALFVDPAHHRRGVGRALVAHALAQAGPGRRVLVDVNEQNPGGRWFYAALGFVERGRSALDDSGRPYPLLHLEYAPPPGP